MIITALMVYLPSAGFFIFLMWFALVIPITERLRQRYTYPRAGYIKLQEKDTWGLLKGTLLFVVAIYAVMAVIVFGFHDEITGSTLLWRWAPFIISMLLVGSFVHLQQKTGQLRYYAYGVLALLSGLVMSMIELPGLNNAIVLYIIGWGVVFLAIGFLTFFGFVWKHPKLEFEDDAQTE
jgi:hypothetical protein